MLILHACPIVCLVLESVLLPMVPCSDPSQNMVTEQHMSLHLDVHVEELLHLL